MPNWAYNKLVCNTEEDYKKLKEALVNEDGNVDFDLVVPIDKDLYISDHISQNKSTTDAAIAFAVKEEYQDLTVDNVKAFLNELTSDIDNPTYFDDTEIKQIAEITNEEITDVVDHFEKNLDRNLNDKDFGIPNYPHTLLEYARMLAHRKMKNSGYADWYDWCLANWGVKWNASETEVDDDSLVIRWNTPWGPPIEVLEALAEKLGEVEENIEFYGGEEQVVAFGYVGVICDGQFVYRECDSSDPKLLDIIEETIGDGYARWDEKAQEVVYDDGDYDD